MKELLSRILLIVLVCIVFSACKSTKKAIIDKSTIQHNEEVQHIEKEYVKVYDSIYVDRWHTQEVINDTIILRDSLILYKEKVKYDSIKIYDTIAVRDTVYVEKVQTITQEPKKTKTFDKVKAILFFIALIIAIVCCVDIKIRDKKYNNR